MRDKNEEKRGYDVTLRRFLDAHGTEIISDYVPQQNYKAGCHTSRIFEIAEEL
jgi:hypothetical protein